MQRKIRAIAFQFFIFLPGDSLHGLLASLKIRLQRVLSFLESVQTVLQLAFLDDGLLQLHFNSVIFLVELSHLPQVLANLPIFLYIGLFGTGTRIREQPFGLVQPSLTLFSSF